MTLYMLSVHHDGTADFESKTMEELQPVFEAVDRFNKELQDAGSWVFAGGLEPIEAATTVDNTKGEALVIDGPFSESKEFLGGFWVIKAADLDEALAWAQRGSKACEGKVEVRPFQGDTEGL
ncbi:hypothetical protein GCM10011584_08560 [Nocardioides phosphati]|uniref:YCII-related domain-containing protein n=1 Tax=Nocardioides phosphati TaxID=1867775 RepID=A0ABQ2N889_9ACTN|nr:YciI family protein [Nocardioides phosphati]GGO86384.1 hypothetical protein GCM10011584_08560 [Nocardioides phosphati]